MLVARCEEYSNGFKFKYTYILTDESEENIEEFKKEHPDCTFESIEDYGTALVAVSIIES